MRNFLTGWRQVGVCVALLSATGMIAATYSVIAVPLAHAFQPSRMTLMLAMTVMLGVSALLAPLVGILMDRSSMRRLMLIGTILSATGFVALSFVNSFGQVLAIYGLLMAPANVLTGPMAASVLLSRWFVRRRGAAIGIAIAGVALGGLVFPPVIQGLLDAFSWRDAYRILGLIVFLLTFPAAALVVDHPSDRELHPDGLDHDPDAAHGHEDTLAAQSAFSARTILTNPTFWCATLVFTVVTSGLKGVITNLMPLALDQGIQPHLAALLISIYSGCAFCAQLGFAAMADKLNMRSLMILSLGGFAAGAACLIRSDLGYGMIALGVALLGLFGGLMVPMQGLFAPRIYGAAAAGRVGGMLTFIILLAMLSTPPLFGFIFDSTGSYSAIFISFAVLSVATMLVVPKIHVNRDAIGKEQEARASGPIDLPLSIVVEQTKV